MFKEFKDFISKGNVMDMAIGVIIANAFAAIVTAFTNSFIQPILGLIGGAEVKGTIPLGETGQALDYGAFITAVINFLIVAVILFLMIKAVNVANKKSKEKLEKLSAKVIKRGSKTTKAEAEVEPETKLCPFCLTEIAYKATRCPHCTSELSELEEIKK
ncbi:MAG: large conductance mechanosensitive channel protein MscL [Clostridia bacterium]|nr:large conductance mechanosensitive channel protein MscL [Clostridia bacterium]